MQIDNVVCGFCGCVCDDIDVTVEDDQITRMKNARSHRKSPPPGLAESQPAWNRLSMKPPISWQRRATR